jgi:hypothetical protein
MMAETAELTPSQKVTSGTRLWSQECREADQTPEDKTAYQFSNGRCFDEPRER